MVVLGAVIDRQAAREMNALQTEFTYDGLARGERVGRNLLGMDAAISQQAAHQFERRRLVSALLAQDIGNLALIIDGAPQPHRPTADPDIHLVQTPQVRRDERAELDHPVSDRLTADLDPAPGEERLNVPDTECEAEIEPYSLTNDGCWQPTSGPRVFYGLRQSEPDHRSEQEAD